MHFSYSQMVMQSNNPIYQIDFRFFYKEISQTTINGVIMNM